MRLFPRILALFLSLILAAPHPALALRIQAGLESDSRPELSRALAAGAEEKFYDAVSKALNPAENLEWNLKAVAQAVEQVRQLAPADQFSWLKTGIKGEKAFAAFETGGIPVVLWFNSEKMLDAAERQEATRQLSYTALLGGQIGPKKFSDEFLAHHPDEPSDFAITFTTGQILDQLLRRNGRVTLVLTKNKKEVASRFAQGAVGRYDGNDPMTFLWIEPKRVDVYFDESSDPGDEARRRLSSAGINVKGVFATPVAVGQAVAGEVLEEWREKVTDGDQYVFGLVTGSTPKPFLDALIPQLQGLNPQARSGLLRELTIVVPDDHVETDAAGQFHNITRENPVSAFTTRETDFVKPANEGLPAGMPGMSMDQVMVPEIGKAATQLDQLPGIDRYFLTFGPQHVFMQFAGEAEDVSLVDPATLLQAGSEAGWPGFIQPSEMHHVLVPIVAETFRRILKENEVKFELPKILSRFHTEWEAGRHAKTLQGIPEQKIEQVLGVLPSMTTREDTELAADLGFIFFAAFWIKKLWEEGKVTAETSPQSIQDLVLVRITMAQEAGATVYDAGQISDADQKRMVSAIVEFLQRPPAAGTEDPRVEVMDSEDGKFWTDYDDRLLPEQRVQIAEFFAQRKGQAIDITAINGVTEFHLHTDPVLAMVAERVAGEFPVGDIHFEINDKLRTKQNFEKPGLMVPDAMMEQVFEWPAGTPTPVRLVPAVTNLQMDEIRPAGWIALSYKPTLTVEHLLSQNVLLITLHDAQGTTVLVFA